jgi:hypothetical protein
LTTVFSACFSSKSRSKLPNLGSRDFPKLHREISV